MNIKTNNNPLVSIIIVNWNRKQDIYDTLKTIEKQTYSNSEVIIVDNGSTDGSQEMINSNFKEYNQICLSYNVGCEEGFNVGIVNATGSIIIFLDNDAFFEETGIEKIVEEFNNNNKLGIVDPRIYNYYSKEIINEPKNWPTKNMFTGCAAGFRKEVFDKIGLRPREYFIYSSEPDICIRALEAGYEIKHCEEIEAYHKESPVKRLSKKFYYYNTRNVLWLIAKYYPIIPGIIEFIKHIIINLLFSIKNGQLFQYFVGLIEGLFKLPLIIYNQRKPLKGWKEGRIYPSFFHLLIIMRRKLKSKIV